MVSATKTNDVCGPPFRRSVIAGKPIVWVDFPAKFETRAFDREYIRAPYDSVREAHGENGLFERQFGAGYHLVHGGRIATEAGLQRRRHYAVYQETRERLVGDNVGLIHGMLHKYGLAGDELVAEGLFGLMRAVERFNPWRGFRFSTYACNVIARSFWRPLNKAKRQHEVEGMSIDHDYVEVPPRAVTQDETPVRLAALQRALAENSAHLNEAEQHILRSRFPLGAAMRPRTLEEVGGAVGVTRERVRQVQNKALRKLRAAILAERH